MNAFLWTLQVVLAATFIPSGLLKIAVPKPRLAGKMPWVDDFGQPSVRLIGVMALLGGIGVVLPAATGIAPVLTAVAATGLAVLMASAATLHVRRSEPEGVVVTSVLFLLAAVVAWGRFGPYSW